MLELTPIIRLVIGVAVAVVPLLGLMELFNRRDRREAMVLKTVLGKFNSAGFRGRITVRVRCGLIFPSSAVCIGFVAASRDELLEIMARLARSFLAEIRLTVTGPVDGFFLATFRAETSRWPRIRKSSRAPTRAGSATLVAARWMPLPEDDEWPLYIRIRLERILQFSVRCMRLVSVASNRSQLRASLLKATKRARDNPA